MLFYLPRNMAMIRLSAKDRPSILIFDPDPSHCAGEKDQRPWGWSRLWVGYYWLASPQVRRNRNRTFENILLLSSSNFPFAKILGLPAAQRVSEEQSCLCRHKHPSFLFATRWQISFFNTISNLKLIFTNRLAFHFQTENQYNLRPNSSI